MPSVQKATSSLTWLHDFDDRLTKAETDLDLTPGSLTLSAPTITGPAGTTITNVAANLAARGVIFRLATNMVAGSNVVLTTRVTLSNGDTDVEDLSITII